MEQDYCKDKTSFEKKSEQSRLNSTSYMDAPEHIIRQQERQQTIEIQQNAENTKSIGNRRKHIEELLVALGEKKA
ncbi:hypothetical protein [Aneurinibacillus aneurinilyticus]|uniref:hypothetical protein n=1 Tax=Aneurinibacillus aneurinilyticus TaxID=1391 RepID=UPI00058D0BE7|nr:hypothetical protein [Aneurinibacillus aneurinilyticus]MCI1695541.1 hypothetical protein [Aneurinibacillus aneurinilyticus]MED0673064.1 hypothetical protein [Aneurinibacillus aneurinilyticus]MED0706934.1 hypothetical protein [Aneurinibacillus aneurinilyticus]MED0721972.1 hypothetical protein [Aneurinibacillus aneurinilyticus]MED0731187.1 hypothetical protein [Aneurinibacillus aneurinilyticus]